MAYEQTVRAALYESRSIKELAEALATEIPPMKPGPAAKDEDREQITRYLMDARQAIMDAGGEERSVRTLAEYRSVALWVMKIISESEIIFEWVEDRSFAVHREAMHANWTLDRLRTEKPKNSREIRPTKADKTPASEAMARWSIDDRRAAARELAHDDEVWEDEDTYNEVAQQVDRHRQDRADERERKAKKRHRENPVGPKMDEVQAAFDLAKVLDKTNQQIEKLIPKLGEYPESHDFWMQGHIERLEDQIAQIKRWVNTGQTDVDRFTSDVLNRKDR